LSEGKKRLLLHTCCAPCSVGALQDLANNYEVTCFFYNPNIDDIKEFELRRAEMEKICKLLGFPLILGRYDVDNWREAIKGLEDEPEGGRRCKVCFQKRLEETANVADEEGFELFCTTLTLSPLKNAGRINNIGDEIGKSSGCSYLKSNFKKNDGFGRSVELSRKYNLYRQNYCGCSFSKSRKKNKDNRI